MKIFLEFLSLTSHFSTIGGISFVISRSLYTSFITILFFHTGVPLGWFFDFLCTGSQSPMGQIPNFPSHQAFREMLNYGLATAHRNITFVICDLCLTQRLFFSPWCSKYLSFSLIKKTISRQHEFCLSCLGIDQDWLDS